ncbi:ATP-binding protein [Streptomyces sp. NPDC001549]|uniref:ATP-binding protein n=1 Tax=Streptomyces sp. NPDC001549 TaxID=3364586 RepID=UPI003680BF89
MAEPTPRRVFADRLSELLGRTADLPIKSAVAEANRRRPAGRGRPVSGRRVSDWKQGRHLPESEVAFLVLVRVLIERWRRWLRSARNSPPDPEPPAQEPPAQDRRAEQVAPDQSSAGTRPGPLAGDHPQTWRTPGAPGVADRKDAGQGLSGEVHADNGGPSRATGASVPPLDRDRQDLGVRSCGMLPEWEEFVGRASELEALRERIEAAARGTGSVVLLAGPAGIGKSTLAAEALRRHADSAGFTVVRGHCARDAVAPPLWPWQKALRLAGITPGVPAQRAATPPPEAGAAAVRQLWSVTEPANASAAQFHELVRMSKSLATAASERSLLILLEDLHWADTASLGLLWHVTREAAECGLFVLGTFRAPGPEEAAGALGNLGRYAATLRLAPFTREEVAQCVGETDAAESYRRTGGLPLLVSALRTHAGDLHTIVSGLLAGLTAGQRDIVGAAAVLGERLDATQLAAVLPESGETVVAEALVAAWHAGVLTVVETTDAGRIFRFTHDLVRDEVLGRTAPAVARTLHEAAARALEQTGDPTEAARIAAHWRRAGKEPGHRAASAHWSRIAADQAREGHAYTDAARHLTDAAAVLAPTDPQRAPALIELARAEYLAGRYDASLRHCAEAADAANATDQPTLLAEAALVLQGVTFPRASRAISRLCRAALAVEDLPSAVRARLLAQLATASADLGSLDAAAEQARAALDLAEATGDLRAELDAARAMEMTLAHPEDMTERLRLGELSVSRAEQLGDPLAAVLGHEWRIQAGYLMGRLGLVDDAIRGIEAIADRCLMPLTRWHLLRVTAARAALEGEFAAARRWNEEATKLALASGDQTAISMNYVLCQQLALVRGDAAELPEEMWRDLDRAPRDPLMLSVRARALFLAGRLDEARDAYSQLRPLLPIPMTNPTWPAVLLHLVDLIELVGDAEGARLAYDQLVLFRPYPGALGTPTAYLSGTVSRELGRLALAAGRPAEKAEELLREALVRNRALGAWPYVALTCLDLAVVQRDLGALTNAAALAGEALVIADRLDQPGPCAAALGLIDEIAALRGRRRPAHAGNRGRALRTRRQPRSIPAPAVMSSDTQEQSLQDALREVQRERDPSGFRPKVLVQTGRDEPHEAGRGLHLPVVAGAGRPLRSVSDRLRLLRQQVQPHFGLLVADPKSRAAVVQVRGGHPASRPRRSGDPPRNPRSEP